MGNKKVCILTSVHPVFDTRIFYKEARTLSRAGYDVTLIAQHNKNEIVEGIKIIPLPKPKNRTERFLKTDFLLFKKALQQKADIYHFHDPELMPAGLFLKLLMKAKVIYDVHEDVPKQIFSKQWLPEIVRNPVSIFVNWFEKLISQKFDYIITSTPDIKNNFKQYNVVDIKNYPVINTSSLIYKKFLPNKRNYILIYVGGLAKIRGIEEIIKSIEFINPKYNIKLKLLGKFSDKEFEKVVKILDKKSKIEFLGWVLPQEVNKYLLDADIGLVCLYPLRRFLTSFPVKMFEYMAAGLPVIASNFPLWKEIIEGNNCGICVNPLDAKEIARAIEYLIEHPEEAKKIGENGRKAVLEKYNWENESKKLVEVYKILSLS